MEEVNGEQHVHEGEVEVDVDADDKSTEVIGVVEEGDEVQCKENQQEVQEDDEVDEDEQLLSDSKKVLFQIMSDSKNYPISSSRFQ